MAMEDEEEVCDDDHTVAGGGLNSWRALVP